VIPKSCQDLYAAGERTSKVFGLAGTAKYDAYCDMDSDGGGWTLAMRVDGTQTSFRYDAPEWTNNGVVNAGAAGHDFTEAKLLSYSQIPLTNVRLEFPTTAASKGPGIVMNVGSKASLLALVGTSQRVAPPNLAKSADWKALVTGSVFQAKCDAEVVSLSTDSIRLRLGFITDDDAATCQLPNSFVGVGGAVGVNPSANRKIPPSAGNFCDVNDTSCNDIVIPSWVFVYVR
jgi:Fibrinogen beta and gamma chains, C-terminal globular domain